MKKTIAIFAMGAVVIPTMMAIAPASSAGCTPPVTRPEAEPEPPEATPAPPKKYDWSDYQSTGWVEEVEER